MSKLFESIKVLHLEPTDVCQAACPACARETDVEFDKKIKHWLTVDDIKRILPEQFIGQLDKMFMCGNYGDPAASDALALFDYFRQVNSNIVLGMNTNGGIQSPSWWAELAERLNQPQDYAVFSIDGLADTNHIYRKNVVWDKVIANATAFIQAGGNAHWDMLVYKYNEHQVDSCEQLAKDMGFKWFRAKVSKRPLADNLSYPINWVTPTEKTGPIDCFALNEKSIYVDAQGRISPCCWLGARQSNFNFKDVATDKNLVCKATCSTDNKQNAFTAQWQKTVELC
jgi:MoaA/NifB/PqqE/SkfB family radical SAM enzyme